MDFPSSESVAASPQCKFTIQSADKETFDALHAFTAGVMMEIQRLHAILLTVRQDHQNEFSVTEQQTLRDLIQKKYALLESVDSIRVDLFDSQ